MFGGPSGKLPSSTANQAFTQVPRANIPRSAFDRSFSYKTTCQASVLVPMFLDEVLPGDTFSLNSTIFARLSTPIVPAMDNLELTTQYFFVPNRLLWENWERFCGAQDDPGDSIAFTIPQIYNAAGTSYAAMTLGDYFGLGNLGGNVGGSAGPCSALPFRAYYRIWNEWYRDENIQNSLTMATDDGPDNAITYVLQQRGRKKDYFYGALTAAQKGTAVPFLSGTANVYGASPTATTGGMALQGYNTTDGAVQFGGIDKQAATFATALGGAAGWTGLAAGDTLRYLQMATAAQYTSLGAPSGMAPPYADLSTNLTDVVNTLRLAFQTQKFLERDARGGTRYIELILSHFGVVNPDFRLQRPEYLGGGISAINTTPVPITADTDTGQLGAFSTALSNKNGFSKSFTEHGWVMGLMNIRIKDPSYQQGIHKMWTRLTRYDYYWPVFASIGEQPVKGREIFYAGDAAGANTDDSNWGWQEAWADYRYRPSMVTGLMKSNATGTLDVWHYAEDYASRPSLNSTYIVDPSIDIIDRNLAITHSATVAQFKVDIFHKFHTARPMPVNSVPGNMDRF